MSLPKTIAGWCTVLYFLVVGLGGVGVALPSAALIAGVLALGVVVFTLLGK